MLTLLVIFINIMNGLNRFTVLTFCPLVPDLKAVELRNNSTEGRTDAFPDFGQLKIIPHSGMPVVSRCPALASAPALASTPEGYLSSLGVSAQPDS